MKGTGAPKSPGRLGAGSKHALQACAYIHVCTAWFLLPLSTSRSADSISDPALTSGSLSCGFPAAEPSCPRPAPSTNPTPDFRRRLPHSITVGAVLPVTAVVEGTERARLLSRPLIPIEYTRLLLQQRHRLWTRSPCRRADSRRDARGAGRIVSRRTRRSPTACPPKLRQHRQAYPDQGTPTIVPECHLASHPSRKKENPVSSHFEASGS